MTEEEKKAIDIINYIKNKTPFIFWYENKPYNRKETIETVLKLIEKQQKELEQEKEKNKELKQITNSYDVICKTDVDYILVANKSYFDDGIFKNNLIHKSKIKDDIVSKLKLDLKSINKKLHEPGICIYRYYRLKGMKTKTREILKYLQKTLDN